MTEATVSFAGNLIDQPEVRSTEGGIARAVFRVAVSGRRDQEASFFTVVVWRDQAEHATESLSKGSRVVVVGRLQQRSWTAEDGSTRSVVEVVAEELGRACVGRRRRRPGRRGARSRRVPRWPGRLNERHPASWKLWLQDLALDSLETSAGGLSGGWSSLALLPQVRRKEVDEEPRGHRQPGWPGVVRSGGGRDG
jgi:single-strand DNA-binding protein